MLTVRDDHQMRAVTGLSEAQFTQLLEQLEDVYEEWRQTAYKTGTGRELR